MGFKVKQSSLLFVLSCAHVLAQTGSISGFTVDAFDGTAVPHVHIKVVSTLQSDLVFDASSDEMGRFSITNVKPSYYAPVSELAGYHPVGAVSNGEVQGGLQVKAESHVEGLRILMSKDAILTARAAHEDGRPILGVQIEVKPIPEKGARIVRESKHGFAGDGGECQFVLTPGRYKVSTSLNTSLPSSSESTSRGAMYEPAEAEVEVSADFRARVDLTIRRRRAPDEDESISGTVKGRPDGPTYTTVQLESGPSPDALRATRVVALKSGDASFRFTELKHEFHRIYATCCREKSSLYSQVVDLTPSGTNREPVELVLAPAFSLKGTVEWSDERGEIRAPIDLRPVVSTPEKAMYCCAHSPALGVDGPFEIPDVAPGLYRVYFYDRHSDIYVKQVLLGDTELKDGILDLRNGDPRAALKIVFSRRAGQLRLNLTDENDQPAGRGKVKLIQEGGSDPGGTWTENWSAGAGSIRGFYGLPPGKYRIIWTDEPLTYLLELDREWLKKNEENAEEIEIREYQGEEQTTTLKRVLRP
jgi:hypothetical protein